MAVYKRGGIWWVDCYVGNPPRRIRKSAKTKDQNVARIVEQTLVGVNRGVTPRQQAVGIIDALFPKTHQGLRLPDVMEFYRQCLVDEKVSITARTLKQRLNVLDAFIAWATTTTQAQYVDEVDTEVAFAYSQELGKRGTLGKTQNSYLSELSTVWKMLLRRSKAQANPWTNVRVQRDRENEHSGRAFSPDEIARLLKSARAVGHDWEGMIVVGLYTGLRMPDVTQLRWADCDMRSRTIRLSPSKTRRHGISVAIPMHPKVYALLATLSRTRGNAEYVFPWRASHPASYKARGSDKSFSDLLAMAKVGAKSDRDKLSFHCLRHTFITRLAEAGVAQDVRMRLAGHTNAATSNIYTHDDASARTAIGRLK